MVRVSGRPLPPLTTSHLALLPVSSQVTQHNTQPTQVVYMHAGRQQMCIIIVLCQPFYSSWLTLLVVTTFTKQKNLIVVMECISVTTVNLGTDFLTDSTMYSSSCSPLVTQGPTLPLWSPVAQWTNKTPPLRQSLHQSSYRLHPTSLTHTHSRYGG